MDGQDDVIDVTARAIAEGAEQDRLEALMDLGRPLPVHTAVSPINFNPLSHGRPTSPTAVGYSGVRQDAVASQNSSLSDINLAVAMEEAKFNSTKITSTSGGGSTSTSTVGGGSSTSKVTYKNLSPRAVLISSEGVVINGVQVNTGNITTGPSSVGRTNNAGYIRTYAHNNDDDHHHRNQNSSSSGIGSMSSSSSSSQYPMNIGMQAQQELEDQHVEESPRHMDESNPLTGRSTYR